MIPAANPGNESERLIELLKLHILDTEPEPTFNELTQLAAMICDKPICLVSLIDEKRQWFKSHHGLDATETPRELAFCAHAILQDDIFYIEDAHQDERFHDNPLVTGPPHVTFYAGIPLTLESGHRLGTLCVIDHKPNHLTEAQREALKIIANQVIRLLELRQGSLLLAEKNEANRHLFRALSHDLKAPVRAFKHLAMMSQKDLLEGNVDTYQTNLERILLRTDYLLNLLNNMLDYTLQDESHPLKTEAIHVPELIERYLSILAVEDSTEITYSNEIPIIIGVRAEFECIVDNLISNAIKYNDKPSCQISVAYRSLPNFHELSFSDNGPGVNESKMEKIFEPFFTTSQKALTQSTGLGLALVERAVKKYGGEVKVFNLLDAGCCFKFTWPKLSPAEDAAVTDD